MRRTQKCTILSQSALAPHCPPLAQATHVTALQVAAPDGLPHVQVAHFLDAEHTPWATALTRHLFPKPAQTNPIDRSWWAEPIPAWELKSVLPLPLPTDPPPPLLSLIHI